MNLKPIKLGHAKTTSLKVGELKTNPSSISVQNYDLSDYKENLMSSPSIPRIRKNPLKTKKAFETSEEKKIHNPESPTVVKQNTIKTLL